MHADKELLTGWLKEGLGWDGMLVTDWADINNLYTREHVAADKKEAIEIAINAGIDMAMEPYDLDFCTLLKELVEEHRVPMSRIDDAVRRVLRLKYRLGLFDTPVTHMKDFPEFASEAHKALAVKAAGESEVLLKNRNGILPLKKGTRLLVTGPNANSMRCLNGGWSYSWQGHIADRYAADHNTIYEALRDEFGKDNVTLEQGVTYVPEGNYYEENPPEIEKAVEAAAGADVIIACIGENSYCETPGNLSDLRLSANQRDLVKALARTGKPVVLILNEGRPRIISDIEPLAEAVVNILLPGNYGADALARILSGKTNPSAKISGQWPFGYGLSYTTFGYDNFRTSADTFTADDDITLSVDVTNTGTMTGKETVMLFSRDMVASLTPENRSLREFRKIELKPGEKRTVSFNLKGSDLAFVGADGKWILEKGKFRMQAGDKILYLECTETHKWDTQNK